jgi:inosine-uridine nucleoside N-ribohydrolase
MRQSLSLLFLLLLVTVAHGQTPLIYDDDGPVQDVGAVQNYGVFYKMVDHGWIKPLAVMANSGNVLSAPGIHALALYYKHTGIPIGANRQNTPDSMSCRRHNCIANDWNAEWVRKFNPIPNDSRENYQDCATLYRKSLATQPNLSVVIVETGYATCLVQLLKTPRDSISHLSGPQLVMEKVKSLVIMGGDYPSGHEFNFVMDADNYSLLFSIWRTQNGYPPIYLVGFNLGMIGCSGVSANLPIEGNAIRSANKTAKMAGEGCEAGEQRPIWDQQAIMFGAWGTSYDGKTYFDITAGGTNEVDPLSGTNIWSPSTNSGHYYLIARASRKDFEEFLDGYSYKGLLSEAPRNTSK